MGNYNYNKYDLKVIPDIHNAGCHGELINYKIYFDKPDSTGGLLYFESSTLERYGNVFENIDFENAIPYMPWNKFSEDVRVTFRNCKFDGRKEGGGYNTYGIQNQSTYVSLTIENCTFEYMAGNAWSTSDTETITKYNLINNMTDDGFPSSGTKGQHYGNFVRLIGLNPNAHADGTQSLSGSRVHLDNCRFDTVAIKDLNVTNASLMNCDGTLSLDIIDCYVNGADLYTIRASCSDYANYQNLQYGCCYGSYPTYITCDYNEDEIIPASTCWISSVWKESDGIHFLATNYVNSDRTITIKTNNGTYTKTIEKCPTWNEYRDTYTSLEDFPFDVEFTVPDADWFVAWDGEAEVEANQIRYVNFTNPYEPQQRDINIIPDKYNTGCTGQLSTITAGVYDSLTISYSSGWVINGYSNTSCNSIVTISNMKFDDKLSTTNQDRFGKVVTVIFNNCEFEGSGTNGSLLNEQGPTWGTSETSHVEFICNNCTFKSTVGGRYITLNKCKITETHCDGMNPTAFFYVNDSYLYNLTDASDTGCGIHVDGTQMAGNKTALGQHVHYNNVRIELPKFHAEVNAPYMYSLDNHEYGLINVSADDCIFNGGGYALYLNAQGGEWSPHTLTNIKLGSGFHYGMRYVPPEPPNATLNNVVFDNTLYVSSVWKDNEGIHFITTNPSTDNRTLKVITNKGEDEYTIAKNYFASELLSDNPPATTFAELPIDIDKTISSDGVNWAVCFDVTDAANPIQIRYVEFEPSPIEGYIDHIELNGTTYSIYDKEALHGNIITTIDSSSTDNDIPTAKAVYDSIPVLTGKELISNKVTTISSESIDSEYPSARCLYLLLGDLEDRLEDI